MMLFLRMSLRLFAIALVAALGLSACDQGGGGGAGATASAVQSRLVGRTYLGEWRSGYPYRITFLQEAGGLRADVFVEDSDSKRTTYNMVADVSIDGNEVTLVYRGFDRRDVLTYSGGQDRLEGFQLFNGNRTRNRLHATGQ